jgi:hypothetical protein
VDNSCHCYRYYYCNSAQVSILIILCNFNWNGLLCRFAVCLRNSITNKRLDNIVLNRAAFVIIMSWTSTATMGGSDYGGSNGDGDGGDDGNE